MQTQNLLCRALARCYGTFTLWPPLSARCLCSLTHSHIFTRLLATILTMFRSNDPGEVNADGALIDTANPRDTAPDGGSERMLASERRSRRDGHDTTPEPHAVGLPESEPRGATHQHQSAAVIAGAGDAAVSAATGAPAAFEVPEGYTGTRLGSRRPW
jgi:hypothetical protein